jgi:hypothetical protein
MSSALAGRSTIRPDLAASGNRGRSERRNFSLFRGSAHDHVALRHRLQLKNTCKRRSFCDPACL